MKINIKMILAINVLLFVAIFEKFPLYAQQVPTEKLEKIISAATTTVSIQAEQEKSNIPEAITFYSPESGEEDTININESFTYIEGGDPIQTEDEPYIGDEYFNDRSWLAKNQGGAGTITNCGSKSDMEQISDKRIVYMLITRSTGKKVSCSGAMIGKYAVLTAAHCLREAKNITVYAGGKNSKLKANKNKTFYSRPYIGYNNLDDEVDWGVVILDRPLGNKTGYFGAEASILYTSDKISCLGFPGSLSKNRPWLTKGKVLPKPAQIAGLFVTVSGAFNHSAWTGRGMSGGPIFKGWGKRDKVIAVHSSGFIGGIASVGSGLGMMPTIVKQARKYKPTVSSTQKSRAKRHHR